MTDIRIYVGADVSALVGGMERAARSVRAFELAAGVAIGSAGLAISRGLIGATNTAISFESAFTGVEKTLGDAFANNPAGLQQLEDTLRDLATDVLPVAYEEIARVAEIGGQLGVPAEEIEGFTETIISLGVATNLVADDAGLRLAQLSNQVGDASGSFAQMGAVITELGNTTATLESNILDVATRIGPISQVVGLAGDEVLAYSAAIAQAGIQSESGGNAIARVFLGIQSAVESGSEQLDIFAGLAGRSSEDFARAFEENAAGATFEFIRGLNELQASGQAVQPVLEALDFDTIRIRSTVLALAASYDELGGALDNASAQFDNPTALTEEAGRRFDDTAQRLQLFVNQLREMAASVGDDLLPVINALLDVLGPFVSGLDSAIDAAGPMPAIVLALAAAGATAGGTFLALNSVIRVTNVRMLELATSSRTAAVAVHGLRAATGIGLAVSAGLVAGGLLGQLRDNSDELTESLIEATNRGRELRDLLLNGSASDQSRSAAEFVRIYNDLADAQLELAFATTDLRNAERARDEGSDDRSTRRAQNAAVAEAQAAIDELTQSEHELSVTLGAVNDLTLGQLLVLRNQAREAEASGSFILALSERIWDLTDAERANQEASAAEQSYLADLGLAADSAAGDVLTLTEAIERLVNVTGVEAERAAIAYQESLEGIVQATIDGGTSLDLMSQSGRDNRQAIAEAAEAAVRLGAAYAESTGDLEGAQAQTAAYVERLIGLGAAAGLNRLEIEALLSTMGLLPQQIVTAILVDESEAIAGVNAANAALENIPSEIVVAVRVAPITSAAQSQTDLIGGRPVGEAARQADFDSIIDEVLSRSLPRAGGGGGGGGGGSGETEAERIAREAQEFFEANLAHLDLLYEIGDISRAEYLRGLETRIAQEDRLTDNWVELWRRRNQVLDDVTREEEDIREQQARLVEQAERILEQAADEQQQQLDQVQELADGLREAVTETADLLDLFGSEGDITDDQVVAVLEHRLEATERYLDGLDQLRRSGQISGGLLDQLANAGPESLGLVEALAGSSRLGEIGGLLSDFDRLGDRNAQAGLANAVGLAGLDPALLTLGSPAAGGTVIQIGAPHLEVQITNDTLIGDPSAIQELIEAELQPALDEFADLLTEAVNTGA